MARRHKAHETRKTYRPHNALRERSMMATIDSRVEIKKVSEYSDTFIDGYMALFEECFGKREGYDKQWFKWFNVASTFGPNAIYCAIETDTNKPVSAYGLLPLKCRVGSAICTCLLNTNSMTSPRYQKRGLSFRLSELALSSETYDLVLATPNHTNHRSIANIAKVLGSSSGLPFFEKYSFIHREVPAGAVTELFGHNIDSFALSASMWDKYDFHIVRNLGFLKWRYFHNPVAVYKCDAVVVDGIVTAYLMRKIFADPETGVRKLHYVDFAYTDPSDLALLVQNAENEALADGVSLANVWCHPHATGDNKAFMDMGYKLAQNGNVLFLHSKSVTTTDKNWHLVLGDNDAF